MKILVTVLARGGSKEVKDKNIRNLAGKPLIAHTIEQVIAWEKYDEFIVSTDSRKIAEIAERLGADVPFKRPAELAGDKTGKLAALRHALIESEKYYNKEFDIVFDLDATAPIRIVNDMDNIVELFLEKMPDSVFSVVKSHKNPYFNMVEENPDGTVSLCKKMSGDIKCRQDAPKVYDMNASMYVYKRDFILDPSTVLPYSGQTYIYEMSKLSGFDIDREIDFKLVELIINEELYQ